MPPRAPRRWSVAGASALLVLGPLLLVASVPTSSSGGAAGGLQVSLPPIAAAGAPVLAPGLSVPLDLNVTNPYGAAVEVTDLRVRIRSVTPAAVRGCTAGEFVTSDAAPSAMVLPAHGSATLSSAGVPVSRWPRVGMPSSAAGRDACRGLEVALDFAASGRFW
jgi:hypothetical protein